MYVQNSWLVSSVYRLLGKPSNVGNISTSSYKRLVLFLNMRKWTKFGNLEMLGTWVNFNFLRSELFVHESFTCYWHGKQPDRHEERELLFFISLNISEMKSDQAKRHLMLRELDIVESVSVSVDIWQAVSSRYYRVTRHLLQSESSCVCITFQLRRLQGIPAK